MSNKVVSSRFDVFTDDLSTGVFGFALPATNIRKITISLSEKGYFCAKLKNNNNPFFGVNSPISMGL